MNFLLIHGSEDILDKPEGGIVANGMATPRKNKLHFGWQWTSLRAKALALVYLSLILTAVAGESKVKGGYYSAGSSHLLPLSGLDAALFTHLFYAFAKVEKGNPTVSAPAADIEEMTTFPLSMKAVNPDVYMLISISASSTAFPTVLKSNASRNAFINSSISLARAFHFDGLDLDWEFPQSQDEMDALAVLLAEWRGATLADAERTSLPPLLLTAAVYFASTMLYNGKGSYPISAITLNLDFVNIMCYDFHGSWDVTRTGANANLYDPDSVISTDHGITSWLDAGLPPEKAVLGLTLYGRSWILEDQNVDAGLNAPATAAGPVQPASREARVFYYFEVADWIEKVHATVVHDSIFVTGYCYADNVWISYEDPVIISSKVRYAISKDLRGYFFWAVSYDRNWEVSTAGQSLAALHLLDAPCSSGAPLGAFAFNILARFFALLSSPFHVRKSCFPTERNVCVPCKSQCTVHDWLVWDLR